MIREDYNIDIRATLRHKSSILEHRIVYTCRYRCVYFSSLFPERVVSHDRKNAILILTRDSRAFGSLRFTAQDESIAVRKYSSSRD